GVHERILPANSSGHPYAAHRNRGARVGVARPAAANTPSTIGRHSTGHFRKPYDSVVRRQLDFSSLQKLALWCKLGLLVFLTQCAFTADTSNAPPIFSRMTEKSMGHDGWMTFSFRVSD